MDKVRQVGENYELNKYRTLNRTIELDARLANERLLATKFRLNDVSSMNDKLTKQLHALQAQFRGQEKKLLIAETMLRQLASQTPAGQHAQQQQQQQSTCTQTAPATSEQQQQAGNPTSAARANIKLNKHKHYHHFHHSHKRELRLIQADKVGSVRLNVVGAGSTNLNMTHPDSTQRMTMIRGKPDNLNPAPIDHDFYWSTRSNYHLEDQSQFRQARSATPSGYSDSPTIKRHQKRRQQQYFLQQQQSYLDRRSIVSLPDSSELMEQAVMLSNFKIMTARKEEAEAANEATQTNSLLVPETIPRPKTATYANATTSTNGTTAGASSSGQPSRTKLIMDDLRRRLNLIARASKSPTCKSRNQTPAPKPI